MSERSYLIGYTIAGHMVINAANPQAAAAIAIAGVRSAEGQLETYGEVEYQCPNGGVIDVSVHKTRKSKP